VLSASPVLRSQEAALEDLRLERADKPMVAAALQNLIGADLLSRLHIDLLEAVRALTAADKTPPTQSSSSCSAPPASARGRGAREPCS
jgi:hypothetical protein